VSDALGRLTAALTDRYRIERELGQGGMATVYLAADLKHDRRVALKVLKPELAAVIGAERFLAEIKTTANLQHPHILPLFDSGPVDGTVFYAMPFVEGETLRARLSREKQLPIPEAVRITSEIASALDYAHRHGVIHRDIKPENILLHDGQALVADFGIALAASRSEGSSRMTETGMSLGTPHYMSPEQAMGERDLDARTDVYALGCMLYEMLSGETPFTGPTAQAIIEKVMSSEPEPVTTLRRMVPRHVAHAIHIAIQKLPADRFPTAAAFAEALINPATHGTLSPFATASVPLRANRPALAFAGLAALATISALWGALRPGPAQAAEELTRFALSLPAGQELAPSAGIRVAFAPDGRSFVYAGPGSSNSQLWLRKLGDLEAAPLAGSDGATSPSFSPDGQEIGFVTLNPFSLKIVSLASGQSRLVSGEDFSQGLSGGGLAWAQDGFIYVDAGRGLARVHPDGTGFAMVMPLDTLAGEAGVAWPALLPEGRGILVRVRRGGDPLADYSIVVVDLRDGSRKRLVRALVARYSPTGHLFWVTADGSLHAQRFDLDRLELTGAPALLWSGLAVGGFGSVDLALSPSGDLLYATGAGTTGFAELVWVARNGATTSRIDTTAGSGFITGLALSPDGSAAALELLRPAGGSTLTRIWVMQLGRGQVQLVTSHEAHSRNPAWSPDGRDLFYSTFGGTEVWRRRADGSGGPALVLRERRGVEDLVVGSDGKTIVFRSSWNEPASSDLLQFRIGVDSAPAPLLATPANEQGPALSPDGRWLAYASNESGRYEVYVRPFPEVEASKVQVSVNGGSGAQWSAGGGLFYVNGAGDMMAAQVSTRPTFAATRLDRLFNASGFLGDGQNAFYAVSADGQRFLMLDISSPGRQDVGSRLVMVQHFAAELARRLPP